MLTRMGRRMAYIDHLADVALFRDCSKRDLAMIARSGDHVTVSAGTVLTTEGKVGHEAFVLLDGTATAVRRGKAVATMTPGMIIGELSLLDQGHRTATVTCDTECTLLVLSTTSFFEMIDAVPAITRKLLASLAGRIREIDRRYYG